MPVIDLPIRYQRGYPAGAPLGDTLATLPLRPESTALLLVDVYNAAAKPEARHLVNTGWEAAWWRIVDENLVPVVNCARALGLPIVYTTNSSPRIAMLRSPFGERLRDSLGFNPEVDFTEPQVDPREYQAGEPVQLVIPPQIAPRLEDYYVRKHTYSGFFETRLDSVLRNLGANMLLVGGFVADVCVQCTLADAVFRGYHTVLLRDCTLATETPDELERFEHTARTILWLETFLGPTATAADFVRAAQTVAEK